MTITDPQVRVLEPANQEALERFLLPRLASSMFLISNSRQAGLRDDGQRFQGTYAAAFDGDEIVSVAAHYWNMNLILQAPTRLQSVWRAAVAASRRPVRGIIGPAEQVVVVRDALALDPAVVQFDETERLYTLDLAALREPDALRDGVLRGRRIEPRDLDLVTRWRVDYVKETLGERDSPDLLAVTRASMEASMRAGEAWILEDQHGTPLAQTAFNAAIAEAVQVGGVWTPPALRGRGYGRAVVAASLRDARNEGKQRAILFTGESNMPAQKAYHALGFQHIGDYRIILLYKPLVVGTI
jgi:uncharacterized protein